MSLEELRAKRIKLNEYSDEDIKRMDAIIEEGNRVIGIAANADIIIDDIDKEFEKITALDNIDIGFMLFAAMLQTTRWILMKELELPSMEELNPEITKEDRLKANERSHNGGIYNGMSSGSEYEHEELKKYLNKHKEKANQSENEFYEKKNKYRSWIEIIKQPVPYDAMNGLDKNIIPNIANLNKKNANGTYNNIFGSNHHVATLGHDPVLGWIFGTANIMTNTISFADFRSYRVQRGHKIKSLGEFVPSNELLYSDQVVDYTSPCTMLRIFYECALSAKEDGKRIVAAVTKQAIHLASDKYCIEGLPIPLLSTINAEKAQKLIETGWNSVEFERLLKKDLKQIDMTAGISILINLIIEAIYLLFVDRDEATDIRRVRVNKILSLSGTIASSSNVLYVALSKNYSRLDIGGIGITMLELLHSAKFISEIKQEYIRNHFEEIVMNGDGKND